MQSNFFERRHFLKKAGQTLLAAPIFPAFSAIARAEEVRPQSKSSLHKIHATARESKPKLVLNVRDFGALGDGTTKDTAAIQQAVDRCSVLGGGEVLIPAGNYFTGAIALRTRTLLRLDKEASSQERRTLTIILSPRFVGRGSGFKVTLR